MRQLSPGARYLTAICMTGLLATQQACSRATTSAKSGVADVSIGKRIVEQKWHDWSTSRIDRVYGGEVVTIRVTDVNRLCFAYGLSINEVPTTEKHVNWTDILPKKDDASEKPEEPAQIAIDGVSADDNRRLSAAASAIAAEFAGDERLRLARIARNRAVAAVDLFQASACPKAGKGLPASSLRDSWETVVLPRIIELRQLVAAPMSAGSSRVDLINQLTSRIVAPNIGTNATQARQELARQLGNVVADAVKARENNQDEWGKLQAASDSLVQANRIVQPRLESLEYLHTFRVGPRTDSVIGILKAVPEDPDSAIVDTVRIAVRRRLREFVSTGFMLSAIGSSDIQSVNSIIQVPRRNEDGEVIEGDDGNPLTQDSIVSRYADVGGAGTLSFAPTLLAHMVLTATQFADLGITVGTAVRTVNKQLAPEFLVGITIGLGDRFTVNPMWHWGRVEKIADDIAELQEPRGVPEVIKRESAVRTKWKDGPALVFSIRI